MPIGLHLRGLRPFPLPRLHVDVPPEPDQRFEEQKKALAIFLKTVNRDCFNMETRDLGLALREAGRFGQMEVLQHLKSANLIEQIDDDDWDFALINVCRLGSNKFVFSLLGSRSFSSIQLGQALRAASSGLSSLEPTDNLEIVQALLKSGTVNPGDVGHALINSCLRGDQEVFQLLLPERSINKKHLGLALCYLCKGGHLAMEESFVESDQFNKIEVENDEGVLSHYATLDAALIAACRWGYGDIVQVLSDSSLYNTLRLSTLDSALATASGAGHSAVVSILLANMRFRE